MKLTGDEVTVLKIAVLNDIRRVQDVKETQKDWHADVSSAMDTRLEQLENILAKL